MTGEGSTLWRTAANSEQMLDLWAAHCSPWGRGPDRYIAYADWLRRATPDQRHAAALNWNWDYGTAPLLYIIARKDCDRATALAIYFAGSPSFYRAVDADPQTAGYFNSDELHLYREVRSRLAQDFYRRSEIAFDGLAHFRREFASEPQNAEDAMVSAVLAGRQVVEGPFDDGVPAEIVNALPEDERDSGPSLRG